MCVESKKDPMMGLFFIPYQLLSNVPIAFKEPFKTFFKSNHVFKRLGIIDTKCEVANLTIQVEYRDSDIMNKLLSTLRATEFAVAVGLLSLDA